MSNLLRDSPIGGIIRYVTRRRYLKYPEEVEGFEIPWEKDFKDGPTEPEKDIAALEDPEKEADELESQGTTTAVPTPAISGTTTPGHEAADVEQGHPITETESNAIQPKKTNESNIIQPKRTNNGIILVDWYTDDDPANPQNWSTGKKSWVAFLIL